MKTILKFAFIVSLTAVIAACGPHGNRNERNNASQNDQGMSQSDNGFRHHGGGGKLRRFCADDIQKYCTGGQKIRRCLRENSDKLQATCKTALDEAIERSREKRREMRQNNQGQQNGTQPQNQTAPQNNNTKQQPSKPSNDDDDDN